MKLLREFLIFGTKQAYASLFGILILIALILSNYVEFGYITRFDFIFLFAALVQIGLIIFKLESKKEVILIAIFHFLATGMELFKTSPNIESWTYQGQSIFMIATVPLFAGFLYSAVGSYIARIWRIFNLSFKNYPRFFYTVILAVLAYANFISHHFLYDIRYILFVFSFLLFWKTKVTFTILKKRRSMSLLLGFLLVSFFIWIAENMGTFSNVWLYPNQYSSWEIVSISKIGSWYLLMILSFVLVSFIYRKNLKK